MNLIYGTRYNILKKDFESLLKSMKDAGAELFFVSKSAPSTQTLDILFKSLDGRYKIGREFVSKGSKDHVPKVLNL
jgi:hypothetical protein